MNAAGRFLPAPHSGPAKSHTDLGTIESRCTLDLCVRVQLPLPAQPGSWPGLWQAPPPTNLFCPAGVVGDTFWGARDPLGLMYYIYLGITTPIKGWKWLWLCLWGPGIRWGLPTHPAVMIQVLESCSCHQAQLCLIQAQSSCPSGLHN